MSLVEDSLKIEKEFRDKIKETIAKNIPDEAKIESISLAGVEYFNNKLKMMVRFYEENKEIQKALTQEKIEKEIENYNKRKRFEELSKKETDIVNCIIKFNGPITISIISNETKHTWTTVNKYIYNLIKLGFVEEVKSKNNNIRMKKYQIAKEYETLITKV